jgi:flavin prenyltransferase
MTDTRTGTEPRHIAVGVTGASGAIYAVRTIAALLEAGCHLEVVFSDYGRRLLMDELGADAKPDRLHDLLVERYGDVVRRGTFVLHSNKDLGASLASGSHRCDGMVIVPCSMKTMGGVAHALSRSLIERAADVMLKERRTLVLVPRETPFSAIHLRNMLTVAEAGGLILPANPGFYHRPQTVGDLVDYVVARVLDHLGVDQSLMPRWGEAHAAARLPPES